MAQLKSTIVQGALTVTSNVVANKLIKNGGTSSQILMADGSVKGIGDLITVPNISITDTGTKPIVGDITSSGHTITVTRIDLDDLGLASAYKYKGSKDKYSSLPTSGNTTGDVWNVTDTGMNYAWTGTAWDALGSTIDTSGFVSATKNASVSVAGTTKDTYTYNKTTIFAPNGLIMGGTAAAAGLVTRGICGVSTPDATTGACTKDNLYLNFDGGSTTTWSPTTRGVIINAGSPGTDLGNGMYQYCAVRGDIVKAWVEAKKYLTAEADTLQTVTTRGATTDKAITTAGLTISSGYVNITGLSGFAEGIRLHPVGGISSIWWNATTNSEYCTNGMWGVTAYDYNHSDSTKKNTFRFRGPTSATATSPTDQMWINSSGLVTTRGGFEHGGLTAASGKTKNDYILLAGGGTKAVSDFATATGYLPLAGGTMTGAIVRHYTAASTDPVLKIASNNFDINIFKVYSGDQTYANTGVYGYNLVYNGTGSGVANNLTLNCDNQNAATQVIGWQLNQAGQMGIGTSASTSYRLTVNGSANATTLYENGTSLANKYAAKGHNHDAAYLSKTTYEWNKEYAAGSNGAVSLGRYNLYDTQLTFDITTTTTLTISGKLVIAAQNGSIKKVTIFGDASNTLAGYLTIYQSAISNNRSWVEVFCNFPGWSKNKVHIYGVALNSATVTNQMASVTFTNGVPSGVTSGDTKWTGTIVNDITSNCALKSELHPDYVKVEIATSTSTTSGTLSTTQLEAIKANPHKTVLVWAGFYCFAENLSSSSTWYYSANCTFNGTTSIDKKVITLTTSSGAWSYSNYQYANTDTTYGADRGISLVSGKFGHSNTAITAQSTKGLYKISYDAYGHITGTESFSLPTKNSWNYDDTYVKYSAAQTLTDAQKTQARTNIGAGTSNFSGSYNDLTNKPTIPTVNNGTLTMSTSGTGVSGSATFTANQSTASTFTVTLDSSAAGNRGANKVVLAKAAGQIDSDKFTVTNAGATAVTMEYDSSYKALKFVFA